MTLIIFFRHELFLVFSAPKKIIALEQTLLILISVFAIPAIVLTGIGYAAAGLFHQGNLYLVAVYPSASPGSAPEPAGNGPIVFLGVFGMKIQLLFYSTLNSINLWSPSRSITRIMWKNIQLFEFCLRVAALPS